MPKGRNKYLRTASCLLQVCVGCAFLDAVSQQIEHCGTQARGMLRVTASCFSIPRTDLKVELDSSLSGTLAGLQGAAGKGE